MPERTAAKQAARETAGRGPGPPGASAQTGRRAAKKRKHRQSVLLTALGAALMIAALLLFLHTSIRDWRLERQAAETVAAIHEQAGPGNGSSAGMATAEYGGYEYIGCLSIPALDLELPMMADWSDEKLKMSPCHYYGSLSTEDMVLMAHNYAPFFGHLKELSVGDALSFTDMSGQVWAYTVAELEVLPPSAVQEMIHSGYPLTLFTCTDDNENRLTVRCAAADEMG